MTTQQWIALGIFVLSYGLIISEKVSRNIEKISLIKDWRYS
jgi:hypothetical protein